MEARELSRLRREQSLRRLPDGREGVSATIQWRATPPTASRAERRRWLESEISKIVDQVAGDSVAILPDSVSVSGQTVDAVISVADWEAVLARLSEANCRVDLSVTRQVLEPL